MKKWIIGIFTSIVTICNAQSIVTDDLHKIDNYNYRLTNDITGDLVISNQTINIDLSGYTLFGTINATSCDITITNGYIISTNLVNKPAIRVNNSKLTINNIDLKTTYHGIRLDGESYGNICGNLECINNRKYTLNLVYLNGSSSATVSGNLVGTFGKVVSGVGSDLIYLSPGTNAVINHGSFYRTNRYG